MAQDPSPEFQESVSRTPLAEEDAARAFNQLVREHYARLCSFAFRLLSSREGAEDAVHNVLMRVWVRRPTFDFSDPLPYLYRAVRNETVNTRRQDSTEERSRDHLAQQPARLGDDASVQLDATNLASAVTAAVDALPERCRLIFTMHREQGLRYAEIARVLGLSEKTVENQMSRAFKALRHRLAPYLGVTLSIVNALHDLHRRL